MNFDHQQALTRAVTGIVAQGKLAKIDGGECLYRSPDGCKCGVGHLIPDDRYNKDIEGTGVENIDVWAYLDPALGPHPDRTFLRDLQFAHDSADSLDKFLSNARELANSYELEMPQ